MNAQQQAVADFFSDYMNITTKNETITSLSIDDIVEDGGSYTYTGTFITTHNSTSRESKVRYTVPSSALVGY